MLIFKKIFIFILTLLIVGCEELPVIKNVVKLPPPLNDKVTFYQNYQPTSDRFLPFFKISNKYMFGWKRAKIRYIENNLYKFSAEERYLVGKAVIQLNETIGEDVYSIARPGEIEDITITGMATESHKDSVTLGLTKETYKKILNF